ncbi:hypothetical protein AK830_g11176 [Neonectria ditissima]|uniref:Uncharacterized protein n=1 Tax=Neonectria ditissima TaxID=78410 RepID=A0A0P7ADR2_9HYPO|nr:hypothetical protein AK830_g11176 [Neonectria ditissima]
MNVPASARQQSTSEPDLSLSKRARLTQTDLQRPGSVGGSEHRLQRARLTRKNLTLFDKMTRKGTSNESESGLGGSSTVSTKTTSTTMPGFAMQALDNGILDPSLSKPPENLHEIRRRHAQSRASASYSESAYNDYVDQVENAPNEATMVAQAGPKLLKGPPRGYQAAFNQAFTGLPKEVGFNNGLSAPQPDFVEGVRRKEYYPFPVDRYVSGAALHKDDTSSVTLPHIAGEWKARGKNMEVARLQSSYDGAALVYARNQALVYLGEPDKPGHAKITTFTADGTSLNHYAHYTAPSENGTLEYHQYLYATTNLLKSHQDYNEGRRGLRNAQDYAREQSCALRDRLKKHWKQRRGGPCPVVEQPGQPPPPTLVPLSGSRKRRTSSLPASPVEPLPKRCKRD